MSERTITCYEVASRISERVITEYPGVNFYVLGGIATGALADPESDVDTNTRIILPTTKSDLPVIRENGTKRDADILVRSTDDKLVSNISNLAEETAAGDLRVDVFGIDEVSKKNGRMQKTLNLTAHYWTSRRELDPDGNVRHVLLPFSAIIPEVAFEPWAILPPGDMSHFDMVDPAYHLICYDLRSIGGLRNKDRAKLIEVRERARKISAEAGANPEDFADLDRMALNMRAFCSMTLQEAKQEGQLILKAKSNVTRFAEDQKWVVNLFQKPQVQRIVRPFVGSKKSKH